jgi:hypothetical protein
MRFILFSAALLWLTAISCSEGPKDEDAMVDQSLFMKEKGSEDRKYYLDSLKSFISWVGANNDIRHYGIMHIKNGFILVQDSTITGGELFIKMSDIEILDLNDNPSESSRLSEFLDSKEIFDIINFPVARFEIDSVRPYGTSKNPAPLNRSDQFNIIPNKIVFGKLSIKGNTKPISFPAKIDMRHYRMQGSAELTLENSVFGIKSLQADSLNPANSKKLPDSFQIGLDILATAR